MSTEDITMSTEESRRADYKPVKPTLEDPMREGVHSLWKQDLFVDYKIQVEDREFQVHKVILASMSDYFRAMLSGNLSESEQDKVVIEGVTAAAVEILIKFIYTSHLDITPENVSDVLAGAMYFQIKPAIQMCSQFMIENMDLENWYDILTLFKTYNLTKEVKTVQSYVIRHMRAIGRRGNHTGLPYEDFLFLVQNWQSFEVELALFIMQWIRADIIPRSKHFDDLLCSMRLSLMTPTELSLLTNGHGKESLPTTDTWNAFVNKASAYHKLPIRHRVLDTSDQSKVRSSPNFVTFSQREAEKGGYFYEAHNQNSFMEYSGLKIPEMFGLNFPDPEEGHGCYTFYQQIEVNNFLVVAVVDDMRAVMGGERSEQWYIFDPRTIKWEKMANLAKSLFNPTLVHDDKHIYAIGGKFYQSDDDEQSDKIDKYDFESDTWSPFSTLVAEVEAYAACICNGYLYMSGGVSDEDPNNRRQKRMDRLDLMTGEWESKAPMLKRRSCHLMRKMKIHGEEGLLIIDRSDYENKGPDIEFYSPSKDEWVRCDFIFDGKLPDMNRNSWVRGNSVFVSEDHTRRGFFTAKSHCAIVTFPEEGNAATVEYLVEFGGRFHESAFHTVLSIAPHNVHRFTPP